MVKYSVNCKRHGPYRPCIDHAPSSINVCRLPSVTNQFHCLQNDRRFLVLDCVADDREEILLEYIAELAERGPPPPPTATARSERPTRR